ncbi:damage-inducible protein DinB [Sphingobacteriales bacterium UPWRP_1]|nr:damage-inducible protein DinB [Sphingobacteriales bacterium UPWRP_1]
MNETLYQLWLEARTRFSNQLATLADSDLKKKLGNSPNSVGFLIRHIADVELLFAKNVFGLPDVRVLAKTVIEKKDTGEWTDLQSLLEYQNYACKALADAIKSQANWNETVTTKEFGTKTKPEALGRIISHTAYHAGQMAIILKYGQID